MDIDPDDLPPPPETEPVKKGASAAFSTASDPPPDPSTEIVTRGE